MKNTSTSKTRIAALLLAIVMAIGLAACGADTGQDTADSGVDTVIEDTGTLPDNNGLPTGDKAGKASGIPRGNGSKTSGLPTGDKTGKTKPDPEKELKRYGDIETLVKSVKTPTKPTDKTTSMSNGYGTVDWSTSHQGYITFTAKGQERVLILQGPNDAQGLFEVANGDSIKVALTGGAGKYQYAIANNVDNDSCVVQYKNSFNVKTVDSDLAPYLVSTAWGDYENAPNATAKAKELWDSKKTQLENVEAIADWVGDLDYNRNLKQGTIDVYVNPDSVIENGGGVCNEMSKLLVAMLRSKGVPAYYQSGLSSAGTKHAWVCAWVELSSSTKDGVTYSKGAWIVIEAVEGNIQFKSQAKNNYNTESNNYAN